MPATRVPAHTCTLCAYYLEHISVAISRMAVKDEQAMALLLLNIPAHAIGIRPDRARAELRTRSPALIADF